MCLGIPVQVIECGEHFARCAGRNGEVRVDLSLVGQQLPGVWLLTFLEAAREVIDAERADAINAALNALEAAHSGETDFSAFFADLEREPQLPDFLRTQPS
ncbi:HypC/HybG/HupF family hydrogenase formation chaperone [Ferribacterium limneticum]|uniref:HypC/HybG/HupF family hydrogenase formation chaperone n=1 Tax=Ferribacterium limneticum TaxID=76259 RepID=UPI001CFB971E|nr:HypC/HybG/HupF family hydrogenase formation chaperone [Ferribacterium limneticum]UCV28308.1 HypC/HybG/HupF family hydrogenase formation chaperone [Ferribacterium limneticum]UCV32225.1 HypC/HybG/HupF family hydrogenase formation chaperone [Ferribacterium limneticum]